MSINELFVETPKEKIESFIKSLHPIKTEHELVRLGAKYDGGYLVPNDFKGIKALFSPGVGNESAFEEDFYRQCKLANPNGIYIWQTNRSMSRYRISLKKTTPLLKNSSVALMMKILLR
ncbi:hypothetical protein ckin37_10410 [Helicobacter pylori]